MKALTTAVIGLPVSGTSTIFSILDILSSVGRDWEMLHGAPPQPKTFIPTLLSNDGLAYCDINGRKITPDASIKEMPSPDLIIVPDLHLAPGEPMPEEFGPVTQWIKLAHADGAIISSVCSGAVLLAAAGLLDDKEATTHWGFSDALSTLFPRVKVRKERILIPTGEGHRIITAGGASSWGDLMLYLINRFSGPEEARRIAKVYLLEPHLSGQLCFASLTGNRQHEDNVVRDAQVWAAEHYSDTSPVSAMASRSGLSERGFLRRFKRATGQSPSEYIQTLRVEEAKQLLETTNLSVDEIADEVGYSEPSSLRSAFRKNVGLSARDYRRRWSGLTMAG